SSLGVILYEMLTGDVPFRGETLLSPVLFDPPKTPRSSDRKAPRDLEVICLKCLEKEPRRRYQTAAELGDDLQRWLEGVPIQARRAGRLERAVRWSRKRRWTVTASLAIVVLLVGVGLAFWDAQVTRTAM